MIILNGSSFNDLGIGISNILSTRPIERVLEKFSDGEIRVEIKDNVRNHDVFIIQTGYSNTNPNYSINDYLMETLILIDACKRSMD